MAGRLGTRATLAVVGIVNRLVATRWRRRLSAGASVAATALFGFLWLFALPFQAPLVIAADPTRRAALLIGGAQLAGSSVGPIMAGALVGEGLTRPPCREFAAAALVLAIGLLIGASRRA
ncbi:hypothetical protein AB5I41_08240 [Sphingomonas sp. MMS24-JH45]